MLERILVKELEKFIMIKKIKKLSMALQQRKKEKDLTEEGIDLLTIPWVDKDN